MGNKATHTLSYLAPTAYLPGAPHDIFTSEDFTIPMPMGLDPNTAILILVVVVIACWYLRKPS